MADMRSRGLPCHTATTSYFHDHTWRSFSAMAIATSADCSLASINTCRKPHNLSITSSPSCRTLSFFFLQLPKLQIVRVSSSGCPSPILEEASTSSPTIELDLKIQDSQRFSLPDVDNLNQFLCRLLQNPRSEEVGYEYYEKAKEKPEFAPNGLTLKHLIRYLVRSQKWEDILSLSEDFKIYNVFPDRNTCSRIVSSCIRARKFKVVQNLLQLFESDGRIATLAFYSAMKGYNKLHMFSSTISVFEKMKYAGIVPDSGCYCQIMEAYQKTGDAQKVLDLFHEFESRKLDLTPISAHMHRILCESLGKSGRAFEALEYFRDMKKKGIAEDFSIYSSLICSFASIREVTVAEELLKEAEEKTTLRDPEMFQKLVIMYVEEGLVEKTLQVVKAMKDAKLKVSDCILCTIINGFSKRRGFQAAVTVYQELISQGCKPGQVTYASIINAYCRLGLYPKAEMLFSEMEQQGFDKCVVAYGSMVAMYGKAGRLRDAMRLVAKMKRKGCRPNVWIYNSLIDMHGRAKNLRQVEKLWKEMKRRKVVPDKVSYTSLISAYNKAREFEMCLEVYQEFRRNGGEIDRAMAGMMVGVFSKMSRIDELVKLLQDMKCEGTELDGRLYHSALNALRDAGLQVQVKWLQDNFEAT